jgi:hypothetical protein
MTAERFAEAMPFAVFVATAREYAGLWESTTRRATIDDDAIARAAAIPDRLHVLVLLADWCLDAVGSIPYVAQLAAAMPAATLRCVDRDAHPDLMDAHLTGTARAIPVVIIHDADFRELGWWGPRPAELHVWQYGEGLHLEKEERNRQKRAWYARDRGRTTVAEVLALIERATGRA